MNNLNLILLCNTLAANHNVTGLLPCCKEEKKNFLVEDGKQEVKTAKSGSEVNFLIWAPTGEQV